MPQPCHKCGATKTEPARPGIASRLAAALGYRLRRCSRCRRRRVLREHRLRLRSVYTTAVGGSSEAPDFFDPDDFDGCPRCGGKDYRRVPRNLLERALRWAPAARCRLCRTRFTYPQH